MYITRILAIFLALGLLSLTAGCGEQKQATTQKEVKKTTTEDVTKEAKELVEATKTFTMEKKEAYEQQLAKKIDGYAQKISVLKGQMAIMKGEAQKEMQENLDTLQEKVEDMKSKMQELQDTSGAAWGDLKKGLDKAEENLDEGFSEAMQNFKK